LKKNIKVTYLQTISEEFLSPVLEIWNTKFPKMGIYALIPEAEKDKLSIVQETFRKKNIQLVGGIFPELIHENQFKKEGILLFCFEAMPIFQLYEDLSEGGISIAKQLSNHLGKNEDESLFLLFDAMVPNISTLLDEIYLELANRVHYFGANAGSESFQPMPCLFDGSRLFGNGLLALILPNHKGAVLEHGYHVPEQTFFATSTSGNRIIQIDWKPAFEVYQKLVYKQFGVTINQSNFYELAVHYPFGIVRASDQVVVRIPVALQEDGSLFCVGEVKENSILTLLECPIVDSKKTLDVIHSGVTTLNGETENKEISIFYCAGRRLHLGKENAEKELLDFSELTKASSISGALSLGEIGGSTIQGYPSFQNATIVATSWQ